MGTRVYLACTQTTPLVEGHCLIVPIQHHLSMLEGDDDVWEEVKVRSLHPHTAQDVSDALIPSELYEMPHADVPCPRQGCDILRNGPQP